MKFYIFSKPFIFAPSMTKPNVFMQIYTQHYLPNLKLALPVMAAYAGHMIVGISDNIMVGQYNSTSLSAAAFANSVFANIMVFGIGFSAGLTPLVGQANGEGNTEKVHQLFKYGFVANFLTGIILVLLCLALYPFLGSMGQEAEVAALAGPYYLTLTYSLLPLCVFMGLKQFAEGLESTRLATIFTLSSNLVNIFLNYLLIYGKWGFPEMGLEGAGWATFLSRIFLVLGFALYLWRDKLFGPYWYGWSRFPLRWQPIRELFAIGLPIAAQIVMEVAAFTLGAIMVGWVGQKQLAAHQIAMGTASLTYMIANGMSAATTMRVSNFLGRKDYISIRYASLASAQLVGLFMGACALLFVLFREQISQVYTTDQPVIAIAAQLLIVAALFQLFDGGQVVMLGALRGLSDVKIPTLIALFSYWVVSLPTGYFCAFYLGWNELGVWMGYLVGLALAASLLFWRFLYLSKKLQKEQIANAQLVPQEPVL